MMNLRLLEGIHLTAFQHRFGQSLETFYGNLLTKLCDLHLVEIQGDVLRLTPQGVVLSNEVFQEFITG
jgi:oxygen-independent coproporphyrinogen-3 oxidase